MSIIYHVNYTDYVHIYQDEDEQPEDGVVPPPTPAPKSNIDPQAGVPHPIENAASRQLFDELLNTYYVPMEVWYARTIIDKVICLSNNAAYNLVLINRVGSPSIHA